MTNYPAGVNDSHPHFDVPSVDDDGEGDEREPIPCCFCGKPTTWDPTYQDLCFRCIRAENE